MSPPMYQVLGSTSAGHGKLPSSWERPQDQPWAGRLIRQVGWHMPIALLRWLAGKSGSYLFISSPFPGLSYLPHLSEDRQAGPYWQQWENPQEDRCPGP